jgi:hypothetical protein
MDDASSPVDESALAAPAWVTSLGGPLIVIPVSALNDWHGSAHAGLSTSGGDTPDDYDRACEIDGLAAAISVGQKGKQGLVLADEPAMTCYLAQSRTFVRWLAADSGTDLVNAATVVLNDPDTAWEECGTWDTDGSAVLMDSVHAGSELGIRYPDEGAPEYVPVSIPAACWKVRAVQAWVDEQTYVGLVNLSSPQG